MANNNEANLKSQDIFSEYLNFNNFHNDILNEDFPKPNFDSFDKYNSFDENSIKSLNSVNELNKSNNLNKSQTYENLSPIPEKYNLININNNNNNFENIKKFNFNGKNEIKLNFNLIKNINKNNNQLLTSKNQINLLQNNEILQKEQKQKKLLMNRESAKKSRLKKKAYVEYLEKEYQALKTEYIKIIESQNVKRINNNIINRNNLTSNNKINPNLQLGKENVIFEFSQTKEDNIQNNNNEYINKQKKIMDNLLINQIDLMTPINIKLMQKKFLKLNKLETNDNFQVIKNKVYSNLETIKEIYDITDNDNTFNKKSKGYQLYEFYSNITKLLDKYEIMNKYLLDINDI